MLNRLRDIHASKFLFPNIFIRPEYQSYWCRRQKGPEKENIPPVTVHGVSKGQHMIATAYANENKSDAWAVYIRHS
jgi:hypothetical protein